jgi:hypothetical protein
MKHASQTGLWRGNRSIVSRIPSRRIGGQRRQTEHSASGQKGIIRPALFERVAKRSSSDAIVPERHEAFFANRLLQRNVFDALSHHWAQGWRPTTANCTVIGRRTDFHPGSVTPRHGQAAVTSDEIRTIIEVAAIQWRCHPAVTDFD